MQRLFNTVSAIIICMAASALAEDPPLTPDERLVPGSTPTHWIRYENPQAKKVIIAGSWDQWSARTPVKQVEGQWVVDIRPLAIPFGRHEFKFVIDGEWEKGVNRVLHCNADGFLERPPDLVLKATIDELDLINVYFKHGIQDRQKVRARLDPEVPLKGQRFLADQDHGHLRGYAIAGGAVTFTFDEKAYGRELGPSDRVAIAGNFNQWDGSGRNPAWRLTDRDGDNEWAVTTQQSALRPPAGESDLLFKFVINGQEWLSPPEGAPNATPDGKGHTNLRIDPEESGSAILQIKTAEALDLSTSYVVVLEGLLEKPLRHMATPGAVFANFYSEKPLGVTLEKAHGATTYRLFSPRAQTVHLCLYEDHVHSTGSNTITWLPPAERFPMWQGADGVWELSLLGLDVGRYYAFNIEGPAGDGEEFNGRAATGDPYAYAVAHAENNPIVIDREATNRWFSGWTDQDWVPPRTEDAVIYETHVRDLTAHPSSGVPGRLRGTYAGLLATEGKGTGLDYLKELGINAIEFLPVQEFNNKTDEYGWGYSTVYYFAPEASYARDPLRGSQYYEFKHLVNELHRQGFAVLLDVVYNHVGSPNLFSLIDRKYFFRLNPDYTYLNFSGCGNDVQSESPMVRRFIVDNILYWMKQFHIDGFRFDLAELIDMDTLMAIRDAARAINPEVLLISEPWSFRGEHKSQLKGTGWSAWNNDFRYAIKEFAWGHGNRDELAKSIFGSVETWAADPRQPVNYAESHDDLSLADELSTDQRHDGRNLTVDAARQNRLVATVLFTSLGIPMIAQGQEFMRSKRGFNNTYNMGDAVNALNWDDRDRPLARETLDYYKALIHLRRSDAGAAFRVVQRPPDGYYQWIRPEPKNALGYIVNAPQRHKGASFIVLLNAGDQPVQFEVPVPSGRWRVIGDGTRLDPQGLPKHPEITGARPAKIRVPAVRSLILMNGF